MFTNSATRFEIELEIDSRQRERRGPTFANVIMVSKSPIVLDAMILAVADGTSPPASSRKDGGEGDPGTALARRSAGHNVICILVGAGPGLRGGRQRRHAGRAGILRDRLRTRSTPGTNCGALLSRRGQDAQNEDLRRLRKPAEGTGGHRRLHQDVPAWSRSWRTRCARWCVCPHDISIASVPAAENAYWSPGTAS